MLSSPFRCLLEVDVKRIVDLLLLGFFAFILRPVYGQDGTSPILRFGIEVADDPFGVRIVEMLPTRPISSKLREGDVLVSFIITDDSQKTRHRIGNVDAIDSLKETLGSGKSVDMTLLRPELEAGRYREIVVRIDAIDLLRAPSVRNEVRTWTVESYSSTVPTFAADEGSAVKVSVFYATDRKLDTSNQYSGERDRSANPIKYGVCQVTIPPDHRYGQLEGPKFWKLEFSADPRRHVFLANVSQIGKENTLAAISDHFLALRDQKRRLLVFVHGYNVSFADAARRTAQMHYDLNFPGVSAFYSWPSNATLSGYVSDAEEISWSTPHIQEFLETFDEKADVDEIYLLAHSMGNRGVTQALLFMQSKGIGKKIKEIILASADIDADVFNRDIATRISAYYPRTTVYASDNDKALWGSEALSRNPRVGEIRGGLPTISSNTGLDIVDASAVATDFIGHSFFGDSGSVISDIYNIIESHSAPPRQFLRPADGPSGRFWKFKK